MTIRAMSGEYGVVADGQHGYFRATWEKGGNSLHVYTLTGVWTIEAGSNILKRSREYTGKAFQPSDVNVHIHVPGAEFSDDGRSVTTIKRYVDGLSVELHEPTRIPLHEVATRVTWPCFGSSDVGKTIWIDAANAFGAVEPNTHDFIIPLRESGLSPLIAQIEQVHSPCSISINRSFCINSSSEYSTRLVWGTDNTAAILKAGAAAGRCNLRYVYFDGPGLCCGFGFGHAHARLPEPQDGIAETFGATIWLGECSSFFTDSNGSQHNKRIIPPHAPPPPPPPRNVFGHAQFRRIRTAQAVNVAVLGDSMSCDEVQPPQGAALSPMRQIIQALQDANPGRTFNVANFSSPGATFEWIDSKPPFFLQFYYDQSLSYIDYATRIPGPEHRHVPPDLVILAIGGGNDHWGISVKSMASIVKKIRALPKDKQGNPPDILMMNCRQEAFVRSLPEKTGGGAFVDFLNWQQGREFANMAIRSFAKAENIPFLDYDSHAANALQGWDPSNLGLSNVPDLQPASVSRSSPYRLRHSVRDYACRLTIEAPTGNEAWKGIGTLSLQLSPRPDNVCLISVDESGCLTVQVNTWGFSYEVGASIEAGSNQLFVDPPQASECNFWCAGAGEEGRLPRLTVKGGPQFLVGTPILLPGLRYKGLDGGALRTVITDPSYGGNYTIADHPTQQGQMSGTSIYYGSMMFQPSDVDSGADVIVEGAGGDGQALVTKLTGYTNTSLVSLADCAQTTVQRRASIFLGRIGTPRIVSHVQAAFDAGANPAIEIAITGHHLYVGYKRASDTMVQTICRINVERYGGPFRPLIFSSKELITTLHATRLWADRPVFCMPSLTSDEMWGALQSSDYDGSTGGNGGNHLANEQQMRIDLPLLRVQDFSAGWSDYPLERCDDRRGLDVLR